MKSISGFWAGIYTYPIPNYPSVKFDCELIQNGNALTGETTEADIFKPSGLFLLSATLLGERSNRNIHWTKTYQNADENYALPVTYIGKIGRLGRRISGVWRIGDIEGRFEMRRDKGHWRVSDAVCAANDTKVSEPS